MSQLVALALEFDNRLLPFSGLGGHSVGGRVSKGGKVCGEGQPRVVGMEPGGWLITVWVKGGVSLAALDSQLDLPLRMDYTYNAFTHLPQLPTTLYTLPPTQ